MVEKASRDGSRWPSRSPTSDGHPGSRAQVEPMRLLHASDGAERACYAEASPTLSANPTTVPHGARTKISSMP